MFTVSSLFRLRVSQYLDHATFPVPSTSHAACGFPALRAPICFTTTLMGPILLGDFRPVASHSIGVDRPQVSYSYSLIHRSQPKPFRF